MPLAIDQFDGRVAQIIQDGVGKLPVDARQASVVQAITQRYSKDRARVMVSDVAGNGTASLNLPTAADATFEPGFSRVASIEYPMGEVPPSELEEQDWQEYASPTGLKVMLTNGSRPAASETLRMTWTARHSDNGSTVPEFDFEAICQYAASLCFLQLAAIYVQTGGSTSQADSVNYRTKSQEYSALAKTARQQYFDHVGISDDDPGGASVGPAMAIGEVDGSIAGSGADRLTHPARWR